MERFAKPAGPGAIIKAHYMEPLKMDIASFARHVCLSEDEIGEIIRENAPITPSIARKLADALGTTQALWLNLQKNVDDWDAKRERARELQGETALRGRVITLADALAQCDPDAPISEEDREWCGGSPVGRELI